MKCQGLGYGNARPENLRVWQLEQLLSRISSTVASDMATPGQQETEKTISRVQSNSLTIQAQTACNKIIVQ